MYRGWLFAPWSLSALWAGCWAPRISPDPAWPSLQPYLQGEFRGQQHLQCVFDPDSDRKKKNPCGFATNTGVLLSTEQRWAKQAAAAARKIQIIVTSGNRSPLLVNELLSWSWWPVIIYKSPAWCFSFLRGTVGFDSYIRLCGWNRIQRCVCLYLPAAIVKLCGLMIQLSINHHFNAQWYITVRHQPLRSVSVFVRVQWWSQKCCLLWINFIIKVSWPTTVLYQPWQSMTHLSPDLV